MANNSGFTSIDDYVESFPERVQKKLTELRQVIRETAPGVRETISYNIPTFHLNGNLVHFAGYPNHIGFYPTPAGIEAFKKELSGYKFAKGSVQFPLDESLPLELIRKIVQFRVEQNAARKKR